MAAAIGFQTAVHPDLAGRPRALAVEWPPDAPTVTYGLGNAGASG